METHSYTCAACGEEFVGEDWDAALDEATDTFTADELTDVDVICHECWLLLRAVNPEFDARYAD